MKELHISDELLSSYVDEERDRDGTDSRAPDVEAHLASCELCSARIVAFRNAASLVATPVLPVPQEVKECAVAEAIRGGSAEQRTTSRGRRPQIFLGAVAAALVLAVALPLALLGRSSPTSEASRKAATHGAASTLGRPKAETPAPYSQGAASGTGLSPTAAGTTSSSASPPQSLTSLPDLGAVSSIEKVVTRLDDTLATSDALQHDFAASNGASSADRSARSAYTSCVATTRKAARGGAYGPGFVATATYQGRDSIVTEFWPKVSAPPAGKSVVAVSTKVGCKLLARTTT